MNSSLHPDLRRLVGFTIVELLIVIAIITILAALLLPVLGRAKESGRRAICLSNQHQVHIANILYSESNAEAFLTGRWNANKQDNYYVAVGRAPGLLAWIGLVIRDGNSGSHQIWNCPSQKGRTFILGTESSPWPIKSGWNSRSAYSTRPNPGWEYTNTPVVVAGTLPKLSRLDPDQAFQADTHSMAYSLSLCHRDGVNRTRNDGSAGWVPYRQFSIISTMPNGPYTVAGNPIMDAIWNGFDE